MFLEQTTNDYLWAYLLAKEDAMLVSRQIKRKLDKQTEGQKDEHTAEALLLWHLESYLQQRKQKRNMKKKTLREKLDKVKALFHVKSRV